MFARSLAEHWQAYRQHRDEESREALLMNYLPLVKRAVARIKPLLSSAVEEEDLVSYGLLGLLEAIDRYDESRGVPFEAFAKHRIRGSILDGLRVMGWLPRNAHKRARELQEAMEQVGRERGHPPTERELAEWLGLKEEEFTDWVLEAAPVTLLPLEELLPLAERGEEQRFLEGESRQRFLDALTAAIERLPDRERLVITLYFYEELTLREIAQVLEVTEGRACQLKTQALVRLRLALQEEGFP